MRMVPELLTRNTVIFLTKSTVIKFPMKFYDVQVNLHIYTDVLFNSITDSKRKCKH